MYIVLRLSCDLSWKRLWKMLAYLLEQSSVAYQLANVGLCWQFSTDDFDRLQTVHGKGRMCHWSLYESPWGEPKAKAQQTWFRKITKQKPIQRVTRCQKSLTHPERRGANKGPIQDVSIHSGRCWSAQRTRLVMTQGSQPDNWHTFQAEHWTHWNRTRPARIEGYFVDLAFRQKFLKGH